MWLAAWKGFRSFYRYGNCNLIPDNLLGFYLLTAFLRAWLLVCPP